MSFKKEHYETLAGSIIKNLEKRGMEGHYFATSKECTDYILSILEPGCSITWGGSETIKECGLLPAIQNGNYELIDRATCKTPEEHRVLYGKAVMADYFFNEHQRHHLGWKTRQHRR